MNNDYVTFVSHLDPAETQVEAIVKYLLQKITKIARDTTSLGPKAEIEKVYADFFGRVEALTGEEGQSESRGITPYSEMLRNWRKGNSTVLAVATYYYLHTQPWGYPHAARIDQLLFDGRSFSQQFGRRVPGGFEIEPDDVRRPEPTVPTPHIRLREPGEHNHPSHFSNRVIQRIVGRKTEEKALKQFVERKPGFRWLQLAGAGGQGKSRMAFDLMDDVGDEWERGFLDKTDLVDFRDNWSDWRPTKPHLIIIDYVIGREAEIGHAMNQMADCSAEYKFAVRLLLVERQRWDRGALQSATPLSRDTNHLPLSCEGKADWFGKLNGRDEPDGRWRHDLASERFRYESGVIELGGLSPDELVSVIRSLVPEERLITQTDHAIKKTLYAIDKSGRPLFAYFLAQAFAQGRFRPEWDQPALLEYIFDDHCRKRWNRGVRLQKKDAWGPCPRLSSDHPALRLALLATILRFVDCRGLISRQSWESIGETEREQALALTDGPIGGTGTGIGSIIPALEPDILGEWFVLTAFEQNPTQLELMDVASRISPESLEDFAIRAVDDYPNHYSIPEMLNPEIGDEATKRSLAAAMFHFGLAYYEGDPIKRDVVAAAKWFESAASFGDVAAMFNLAQCYQAGIGVVQSPRRAAKWFGTAAESGLPEAMTSLALCYSTGYGLNEDHVLAMKWYERAAEADEPEAMFRLGLHIHLDESKGPALATDWYHKAARAGQVKAMAVLSSCYLEGVGVEKSLELAIEWCLKAARGGDTDAKLGMGKHYLETGVGPRDFEIAVKWFEAAIKDNNAEAMFYLGVCHERGLGVKRSVEIAELWYLRAKDAGFEPPDRSKY